MSDEKLLKGAVDLIVLINTTINNIRLYPPGSDLIISAINRIDAFLPGLFKYAEVIEFGEFERTLLFQGDPLPEKDQKKPPVNSFLKTMLEWKIRSISFQKEVSKRELSDFIQIVSKTPEEKKDEGALARLISDQKISHIKIDKKIYVELGADQSIVAGLNIRDEDIAKYILGDQPLTDEVLEALRKFAKDPEWLARVFTSGVSQLMESAKNENSGDLSATFARMVASFETISDMEKSALSEYILGAITDMDDEAFLLALTQDLAAVFGENFLNVLVDKADDELFKKFVGRINRLVDTVSKNPQDAAPRIVSNRQLSSLVKSIKAAQTIYGSHPKSSTGEENFQLTTEKKRAGQLAFALNGILKCQAMVSHERVMLDKMDETVRNLLSNQKYATIVTLFGQLGHLLQNKDPEIRKSAAKLLSNIDEQFETAGCLKERILLSQKMIEWIRNETEYSPVYEKISGRLQGLTRLLIQKKCFSAAGHILKTEFSISNEASLKNDKIRITALKLLQNIATEEILGLYLQQIQAGGALPREDDMQGFVILGSVNVDRLLDLLHDSHSRSERNCIVRVVSRIGTPAAGPVIERIQRGGPWFYVRNMALLLGRIGDESHLKILESLLKDKNVRIQREGILAIQNIGGTAAAKLLYQNLHAVDDELKGIIFSFIGNLKYRAPVTDMIGMLESGALGRTKKDKIDIMVKICEAFGRMAEEKAAPVLKRIARPRGFLAKTYDPAVRAAAEEALKQIKTASTPSG